MPLVKKSKYKDINTSAKGSRNKAAWHRDRATKSKSQSHETKAKPGIKRTRGANIRVLKNGAHARVLPNGQLRFVKKSGTAAKSVKKSAYASVKKALAARRPKPKAKAKPKPKLVNIMDQLKRELKNPVRKSTVSYTPFN